MQEQCSNRRACASLFRLKTAWVLLVFLFAGGCRDPLSIRQRCYTSGNKFYEQGKYREAALLYRRALQFDAKFADAWYRLGLVDIKLGDSRKAVAALRRAVALDPQHDDAALLLANFYIGGGLTTSESRSREQMAGMLQPLVDRFVKKDPESYEAARLSGYLAMIERNRQLAIDRFEAANRIKPWQPDLVLVLAENLAVDGKTAEAEHVAEELLARHKDYAPMYEFLYEYYLRASKPDQAAKILQRCIDNVPDDGRARIRLALNYYINHRRPEMLAVLESLRGQRNRLPGADGLIGDFYVVIGDLNSAIQSYRDAKQFNPKEQNAYEEKAIEALVAQHRMDEAKAAAERLYQANSKDAGVAAFRAMLAAQLDRRELPNTIRTLESLVAKNGGDPLIHFQLGRAYFEKGDSDSLAKSLNHLEAAVAIRSDLIPAATLLAQVQVLRHDYQGAVQTAEDVLRRDPESLNARLARAMAFSMMREPELAHQDLMVARAMHPNSAEALLRLAAFELSQKQYTEAAKGFRMVAEAGDARGYIGLANTSAAQGQVDGAVKLLRANCPRFAGFHDCEAALAKFEFQAGHYAEARSGFEKMTRLEPQSAEPYARLGDVQMKLGDAAGALASYRKAQQLNSADSHSALATGVLLDASGQKAQAAAAYEHVLRIDSGNAQALNNFAYLKMEQGADLDRALAMAQQAVQHSPDDSSYADTLGMVYLKRGLIDESIGVFQPLVRKNPGVASFHLHLAMALYAAAQRDSAVRELKLAMHHGTSPSELAQVQDLASKLHLAAQVSK